MAEIAFELLAIALESTRGTPIAAPTHILNMEGKITPADEWYYPPDRVGELAEYQRSEKTRSSGVIEAEGGADTTKLPIIANMVIAPVTTGVVSGGHVTGVTSIVGGTNYPTNATTVTFGAPAAGGRQATGTVTVVGGAVTAITITDNGRGYTSAPSVTITGSGGSGASATAVVTAVATTAKTWEHVRGMSTDVIKSATGWWGDPNQAMYSAAYAMFEELVLAGDASSTDGVTSSVSGFLQAPDDGAAPTLPAVAVGPVLVAARMQVWLEANTTDYFGKTELTGKVVSAEATLRSGVKAKYLAVGPTGTLTYVRVGREVTHPELKLVIDSLTQDEWTLYKDGTLCKIRVRFNGPLIEAGFYHYAQVDIQGRLTFDDWEENETNRAMSFTVMGEKSAQIASDTRLIIQNAQATL